MSALQRAPGTGALSGREQVGAGAPIAGQRRGRDLGDAEATFRFLDLGSDVGRITLPLPERVAARRPDEEEVSAPAVLVHAAILD